jgi:hypothetical protein
MKHYLIIFSGTGVNKADGINLGHWWRVSLPRHLLNPRREEEELGHVLHELARTSFFSISNVVDITNPACPVEVIAKL